MRVYHRETQLYSGGLWAYPVPTAAVVVRVPAGVAVQTVTAVYDAARRRLYFDTTNSLFAMDMLYQSDWTITIGGTAYATTDYHIHCTPTTADTTGPGPATIGVPSVTDTVATFPHTPPVDADYATTTIFCVSIVGIVSASGSGTTIAVPGLTPGMHYTAVAVAYDASGNPSTIGQGSVLAFNTLPSAVPTHAFYVKWRVNQETAWHEFGPVALDSAATSKYAGGTVDHRVGGPLGRGLGKGRDLVFRIECSDPVMETETSVCFWTHEREGQPGGLRDAKGT